MFHDKHLYVKNVSRETFLHMRDVSHYFVNVSHLFFRLTSLKTMFHMFHTILSRLLSNL
jgi:hypothetical protein